MKRNFIKKLLIGGLITSICLCCFINVKADTPNLNDIYDNYPENYNIFGFWDTPQSFKGKSLYLTRIYNMSRVSNYIDVFDCDIYITWENMALNNTPIGFSFIKSNISTERYESTYDMIYCYGFHFRIEYDSDTIYIFEVLTQNNTWLRLLEIGMGGYVYNNTEYNFDYSRIINFPISDTYNLSFTSPQITQENVNQFNNDFGTEFDYNFGVFAIINLFLYDNSIPIIPSKLLDNYENHRNSEVTRQLLERYEQGFQNGYNQGIEDGGGNNTFRFPFLTGIFNGVSDILNIEIFPNIKLSYFIFIPLTLGITGMILWFWRKD